MRGLWNSLTPWKLNRKSRSWSISKGAERSQPNTDLRVGRVINGRIFKKLAVFVCGKRIPHPDDLLPPPPSSTPSSDPTGESTTIMQHNSHTPLPDPIQEHNFMNLQFWMMKLLSIHLAIALMPAMSRRI